MLGMSTIDRLKYYSPYISSPNANPFFSEFKIWHRSGEFYDEEDLNRSISMFMETNRLYNESLYCSYIDDLPSFYGPYYSILWLDKLQAKNLIQLEIEKEQRMIPRYLWNHESLINIEIFSWEHKNKYICPVFNLDESVTHELNINDIDKINLFHECDIQELIENGYYNNNSGILNTCIENLMDTRQQYLKKESDFHKILVYDDDLLKFSDKYIRTLNNMIVKNNPFLGWSKPFSTASLPNDIKNISNKQIYKKLNSFQDKQYSKNFLKKAADEFIVEYERYAKSNSWSYARLLSLKHKYVSMYLDAVEKGITREDDYAFYKIGTKFKIRFNKKELPEHKLDGLIYIHYLVSNEGKLFTHHDLDMLKPKRVVNVGKKKNTEFSVKDDSFKFDMSDEKYTETCINELKRLNKQYNKINETDYPEQKLLIKEKMDKLERFIKKSHHKNGTTKRIRGEYANVQNRIGKAIVDAITWMENQGCKEAATHFENTIEPYANKIGYFLTDTKIKWHTY